MPTSVRLDAKTESLIKRLAKERAQTKSAIIRKAVEMLAEEAAKSTGPRTPYDKVADLVGAVKGGPTNLSMRTGEKFRHLLVEKTRRPK